LERNKGGERMKLWEKIKDRYNILIFITLLICVILAFKLASLTIVKGEEMRRISNSKRVKQISITAPRGEIRDRYGRLLAGNKPSFTVQVMKDELNIKDTAKRNNAILKLIRILDDEGVNYIDEFPIALNVFSFNNETMYMENSKTPNEYVVELLLDNNLIGELINTNMRIVDGSNSRIFFTAERAVNTLENEGISMPIKINLDDLGNVIYYFDSNVDIDKWKKDNSITSEISARDLLVSKITENKKALMKLINNPIVRELTYKVLQNHGLASELLLEPYTFSYDEEYKTLKRSLMKSFGSITMSSLAKDDFVNIILQTNAKYEILSDIKTIENDGQKDNEQLIPGQILINMLSENNINIPVEIILDEEESKITYRYKSDEEKDRFHKSNR